MATPFKNTEKTDRSSQLIKTELTHFISQSHFTVKHHWKQPTVIRP